MKYLLLIVFLILSAKVQASTCPALLNTQVRLLHSEKLINLCDAFTNKPLLIVNTASHCGFTGQFKGLEALHRRYRDQGLVVIGFASNDFNQAAKDEATAARVCYENYGVSFTMIAPGAVTGEKAHPVFQQINAQTKAPSWNFTKYLIDRNGQVQQRFSSAIDPQSSLMTDAVEQLIKGSH